MEAFSPAGAIGALVGLIIGWMDYKLVGGFVEKKLRDTDRSRTAEEKVDYERRIAWFRKFFLFSTVGVFPIVGYFLGRVIAG